MKVNYWDIIEKDIISDLVSRLGRDRVQLDFDGKIHVKASSDVLTGWVIAAVDPTKICKLYHDVYQPIFNFIHPRCLECWKVVATIDTLENLVETMEFQESEGIPAKCGIEIRSFTNRSYGAYWYNNELEEGLRMRDRLREELSFIPSSNIVLKRGCTEYEIAYGNSAFWGIPPNKKKLQELLDERIVFDIPYDYTKPPPEDVKRTTLRQWIQFAYERGDETYLKFTDNKPLYPQMMNYDWPANIEDESDDGAEMKG